VSETEQHWAGWRHGAGSDKVWGGAVRGTVFRSTWGRRGSSLQTGTKVCATVAEALKLYTRKVAEKAAEGYVPVAFDHPDTGVPVLFPEHGDEEGVPTRTATAAPKEVAYVCEHVLPLDLCDLPHALEDPAYGVCEKMNGERCLVAFDGQVLRAYNRKGQATPLVPPGARALTALGHPFVLDEERLSGDAQGAYVVFNVLEWRGATLAGVSYAARIALLAPALADLVVAAGPALADPRAQGLYLLTPETDAEGKRALVEEVRARGGEGVVIRLLAAPYAVGDALHVRKVKFRASVDAFVVRVTPGLATGSATLALVRASDGAVVEVGNVRSGLRDADLTHLAARIAAGERPVLEVDYLPARTVGYKLVEPATAADRLRADKTWGECTTDQLGAAHAALLAGVRPR